MYFSLYRDQFPVYTTPLVRPLKFQTPNHPKFSSFLTFMLYPVWLRPRWLQPLKMRTTSTSSSVWPRLKAKTTVPSRRPSAPRRLPTRPSRPGPPPTPLACRGSGESRTPPQPSAASSPSQYLPMLSQERWTLTRSVKFSQLGGCP